MEEAEEQEEYGPPRHEALVEVWIGAPWDIVGARHRGFHVSPRMPIDQMFALIDQYLADEGLVGNTLRYQGLDGTERTVADMFGIDSRRMAFTDKRDIRGPLHRRFPPGVKMAVLIDGPQRRRNPVTGRLSIHRNVWIR